MSYEEKAFEIIKDSIKSAIFIDEKAKEFYSISETDQSIVEEKLSIDLYHNFRQEGISLAIHKFLQSDMDNEGIKKYLFKGRDLILLDWELDNSTGEEYSLKLLSEIIEFPHINFCCIYTRTPRFDSIPSQVETYFSGLNAEDYEKIRDKFGHIDDKKTLDKIHNFIYEKNSTAIEELLEDIFIDLKSYPFINKDKPTSDINLLKHIYNAFQKNIKPLEREKELILNHLGENSFIVNNTIIIILKKDEQNDPKPSFLLQRITKELIQNTNSFIQLLGLEMQTIFNSNESFIDENILKSSTEALFKHRNFLFEKEKEDKTFSIIIKKLLIEHATLKLRTAKLGLLDSNFLIEHSKNVTEKSNNEELHNLNTFYNSVTVKSLNDVDIPNLNFGDVFNDDLGNYYLCITALCDCYYPNKIDHNFYFVTGKEFPDSELALKLGDTAFLSFLPNGKSVYWGNLEIPRKEKIKKGNMTEEEHKLVLLEIELKSYQDFLYKPYYVKPKIYNVEGVKMNNNKLRIWDITYKSLKAGDDHKLNCIDMTYITTLRSDYSQRIANHAFGHPIRVGVDFVKK